MHRVSIVLACNTTMHLLTMCLGLLQQEGAVLGSCNVLALRPVARYVTSYMQPLTTFIRVIAASSVHDTVKSQLAIEQLFTAMALRLPYASYVLPRNGANQLLEEEEDASMLRNDSWEMVSDEDATDWADAALGVAFSLVDGNRHWKYSMMILSFIFMRQTTSDGVKLVQFLTKVSVEVSWLRSYSEDLFIWG